MKKTFEELLDDYEDAIRNTELERSGPDRDYYRAARADEAVPRKALIEYVEQLEKERDIWLKGVNFYQTGKIG